MVLLSVPEAARELRLDPSRVRALVSSGELRGIKVGSRWAIDTVEVARRQRDPRPAGRPFEPANAWGVLFMASGLDARWLDSSVRWRLRQVLAIGGLTALRSRLGKRAEIHRFYAHPSEIRYLSDRADFVKSGISAAGAYKLGLVPGEEIDAYIRASALDRIQRDHALERAEPNRGNVVLRAVPDNAWQMGAEKRVAPPAAVAIDLAEDPDSRSSRIGMSTIKQLDRDLQKA